MKHSVKILVIRLSSLGDIILTTPLIKAIKQKYSSSEIHYLLKKEYSEIIKSNPLVNKVLETSNNITFRELRKLKSHIKSQNYDIIFDVHNNLKTFYLRIFNRAKKKTFRKYSLRKFLLVKFKVNLMKNLPPVYKRYLKLVPVQGNFPIEINLSESAEKDAKAILRSALINQKKLICIHPVSKHYTKTYPANLYSELIKSFPENEYIFLLTGSEHDKKIIYDILKHTNGNVFDLSGKTNLISLASIIKNCSLLISGDTGPMHIAEALGIPVLMLAGSSVKEFGFYPQNPGSCVLEVQNLQCRPCSHIGRSSCPEKHFRCMREIKPEIIYKQVNKMLKNAP